MGDGVSRTCNCPLCRADVLGKLPFRFSDGARSAAYVVAAKFRELATRFEKQADAVVAMSRGEYNSKTDACRRASEVLTFWMQTSTVQLEAVALGSSFRDALVSELRG